MMLGTKKSNPPGPLAAPHTVRECKARLDVSPTLSLPVDEITRVLYIGGQRGSGKTYSAGTIQEEEILACGRFCVFDPIQAHRGILYAEGVEGVTGLQPKTLLEDAEYWAKEVCKPKNHKSYVFDLQPLGLSGAKRFLNEFSKHALMINKTPLKIYIEEASIFLPNNEGKNHENIVQLATLGRAKGFGVTMISQRTAHINKSVLTQSDAIISMRLQHYLDIETVAGIWMEAISDMDKIHKLKEQLPKLKPGEGIIYSGQWLIPSKYDQMVKHEEVFLKKFRFRKKVTPHLAGTPTLNPQDFFEDKVDSTDLQKAEDMGLKTKNPEDVKFNDARTLERNSRLKRILVLSLGAVAGYLWTDALKMGIDKEDVIKAGAGSGIMLLGNKKHNDLMEGVGIGTLLGGVERELRSQGYLKQKGAGINA